MQKISYLFLLILFIGCSSEGEQSYECEENEANLRLYVSLLYPGERLELYFNNTRFYQDGTDTGKSHFIRWFCLPSEDSLKLKLITKHKGHIILEHLSFPITIEKNERYALIIGAPYPRNRSDLTFPPDWGYVPIDSSKRSIVIEKDTAWPASDY